MWMLALLAPLVLADHVADAGDGPRPSPVQNTWQLQFEFVSNPMRIEVGGQTYWYMLYRVTNPNPEPVHFFPFFTIVTEDLQVFTTDIGIPDGVFKQIAGRHRPQFPDLVSPIRAIDDLRSGEDYARESVAIWHDAKLTGNNFTVYVAGLSGETQTIRKPAVKGAAAAGGATDNSAAATGAASAAKSTKEREQFTLRKTLEIRYTLPGSQIGKTAGEPYRVETQWVMR